MAKSEQRSRIDGARNTTSVWLVLGMLILVGGLARAQCNITISPPGSKPYQASATATASGADYMTMTLVHYLTLEQKDCYANGSSITCSTTWNSDGAWHAYVAAFKNQGGLFCENTVKSYVGPSCAVQCGVTAPATAGVDETVSFAASAGWTGWCQYSNEAKTCWDFDYHEGDTCPLGPATPQVTHQYTSAGTYTWKFYMSIEGQPCEKSGTIVVGPTNSCTLGCNGSGPATAVAGESVSFQGTATPSGCIGEPSYSWDFGDDTGTVSEANPTHIYEKPGQYTWALTVALNQKTCTSSGTIKVSCFWVGSLKLCGDSITEFTTDVYDLSGNVNINEVLWLSGGARFSWVSVPDRGSLGTSGELFVKGSKGNEVLVKGPELVYDVRGDEGALHPNPGNPDIFFVTLGPLPLGAAATPIRVAADAVTIEPSSWVGIPEVLDLARIREKIRIPDGGVKELIEAQMVLGEMTPSIKFVDVTMKYDGQTEALECSMTAKIPFSKWLVGESGYSLSTVWEFLPCGLNRAKVTVGGIKYNLPLIGAPFPPTAMAWLVLNDFVGELDHVCDAEGFLIFLGGRATLCLGPTFATCVGVPGEFFRVKDIGLGYQHPWRFLFRGGTPTVLGYPIGNAGGVFNAGRPPYGLRVWGDMNVAGMLQGRADVAISLSRVAIFGSLQGSLQVPNFSCAANSAVCKMMKATVRKATGGLPARFSSVSSEVDGEVAAGSSAWLGGFRGMVTVRGFSLAYVVRIDSGAPGFAIGTNYSNMIGASLGQALDAEKDVAERSVTLPAQKNVMLGAVGLTGVMPSISVRTPSGATVTPSNVGSFAGFEYIEDNEETTALFLVSSAAAGSWRVTVDNLADSDVELAILAARQAPEVTFTSVAKVGSTVDMSAAVTPAASGTAVSFLFGEAPGSGLADVIADDLDAASGTVTASWETAGLASAVYYLMARVDDGVNPPRTVTYGEPIAIDTGQLTAPTALSGSRSGRSVSLTWTPSGSPAAIGHTVLYTDAPGSPGYPFSESAEASSATTVTGLEPQTDYEFVVVAYDEDGNESLPSGSWSTAAAAPPVGTALTSGVPVSDRVEAGALDQYYLTVPSGSSELRVATTGATANVDVYVSLGAAPTTSSYDYRAATTSGDELVVITSQSSPRPLQAGVWYIGVYGVAAASYTVTATVTAAEECALWCDADVPATAAVGATVAFAASPALSGCSAPPTYDWDFGDASAHSGNASASHSYAAAGTYTWILTVTAGAQQCVTSGVITIGGGSGCSLSCAASASDSGLVGAPVAFSGSATASGCTGAVGYDWDFGDSTAHATSSSPSHTYAASGTYNWRMTASADSETCTEGGTVAIAPANSPYRYVVPSVAHAPGKLETQWRSDVAVVNRSGDAAVVTLAYYPESGPSVTRVVTLADGATVEWVDVLVSQMGVSESASSKGTLHVGSTGSLVVTSRTYNQTQQGTYGQYYPALVVGDGIAPGQPGVLAQIKSTTAYRSNVGVVNLGEASCTVAVRVFDVDGQAAGSVKRITVGAGLWKQQTDIFASTIAGQHAIASATVDVETAGCEAWAYAAIADNATGDPTTIPVLLANRSGSSAAVANAASRGRLDEGVVAVDPGIEPTSAVLPFSLSARTTATPDRVAYASERGTIFEDSFEGAFPGTFWRLASEGNTAWGPSTYRASAGSRSLWCAGGGSSPQPPGGSYVSNMNTWAIYGPFDLSDATAASATFAYWMSTEEEFGTDTVWGDPFKWMISVDGTNFSGYKSSGSSGGWKTRTLDFASVTDIDALGAPEVWFALVFQSDVNTEYEGVYVDGLEIEKTASPASASHRYVVPSVAHAPGKLETQWRSDVAVANRSGAVAGLTLMYFPESGSPVSRTATLPDGATVEWVDVLVSQIGVPAAASSKGTLHVSSTVPVVVTSRTYNQTQEGTYGQYYPALVVGDGIGPGEPGVLAQIKSSAAYRSNVGVVNLGESSCTVAVRLYDEQGRSVGNVKRITVGAGLWKQQTDIFAATGAGQRDLAYAVLDVETLGCEAWAYAAVADNATGDPTTIPVIVPLL